MSSTHPVPPAEGDSMTDQDVDREITLDELENVNGAGLWQDIENVLIGDPQADNHILALPL